MRSSRRPDNLDGGTRIATLRPIYLFSDSQLLFWKQGEALFLESIRGLLPGREAKAAYIGASNGDRPEFYALFEGAMQQVGITDSRRILLSFSPADRAFVEDADLILLAGGDVELGWKVFESVGLDEIIPRKYSAGVLLIGISAGAVQLGLGTMRTPGDEPGRPIDTFRLARFVVGVHEEKESWSRLRQTLVSRGGHETGIGIPSGAGLILHPDHDVEPIRYPLHEFLTLGEEVTSRLLWPPAGPDEATGPA